jgi:hypothetical protein
MRRDRCNAMGITLADPEAAHLRARAVYCTASRINHSCAPNVVRTHPAASMALAACTRF